MTSCLCEYKALVNAYKCEITKKSHFLFVNGYKRFKKVTNMIILSFLNEFFIFEINIQQY